MNRFDLINHLVEKFSYKSYLEIGVYDPKNNFDLIKAEHKVGVDPSPTEMRSNFQQMVSDTFFEQNKEMFDIVFIDGLHHDDQTLRDIMNSLAALNPGGAIVVHDCDPREEDHQRVPCVVPFWCGTVWKAWVRCRQKLTGVEMFVVNTDTGIGVIRKSDRPTMPLLEVPEDDLTFQNLDKNREWWLNMISKDQFLLWLEGPQNGQEETKKEEQGTKETGKKETRKKGQKRK